MSLRPVLEAVICDAGGTLVRLDFEWMAAEVARIGYAVDASTLRRAEIQGRRAYDASVRANASGPPSRGDVRAYFDGTLVAAGVPAPLRPTAVDRFLEREKASGLWCRPMEGAREAVDGLLSMGLRVAVVSNSDGSAERHLEHADMLRGIEFVVDSHRVGIEKPDPAIFAAALGRLGTVPERTLFVGDIRSVDEAGALAAGMRFVLLDPFADYGDPQMPRIAGMDELEGWVERTFDVIPARAPGAPSGAPGAAAGAGGGSG